MNVPPQLPATFVCSPDDTRGSIRGVRLERTGADCRAITTDGHRLSLLTWSDPTALYSGDTFAVTVEAAGITTAVKAVPKAGRYTVPAVIVANEAALNGALTLHTFTGEDETGTARTATVEGEFPDWRQVVPEYPTRKAWQERLDAALAAFVAHPGEDARQNVQEAAEATFAVEIGVNAGYLADACKAAMALPRNNDRCAVIKLTVPDDGLSPMLVDREREGLSLRSVIMPYRT